ncbi:ROK family protein [Candidatus Uhrbacteria bacterium]|nr:ROK family protein [Candidatus Uhrbacteria bacterium]
MGTIIGVDIGGTKIHVGIVSSSGKVLERHRLATDAKSGKNAVLANITQAIRLTWRPGIKGIGIGIAGLVNHGKGIYHQGPNLPTAFKNLRLADLLRKLFKVPVRLDNDVHCFTLAEASLGAAKGKKHVVGLTLGTGIGGGIVIDGRIYRGRDNAAGEIGHTVIDLSSAAICSCGRKGHFEALASGTAVSTLYRQKTGKELDAVGVENAARQGDTAAIETMLTTANALGAGLANIAQTLNPDTIVVGGGLMRAEMLWKPALAAFKAAVAYPSLTSTSVVRAKLANDSGIIGAALLHK